MVKLNANIFLPTRGISTDIWRFLSVDYNQGHLLCGLYFGDREFVPKMREDAISEIPW